MRTSCLRAATAAISFAAAAERLVAPVRAPSGLTALAELVEAAAAVSPSMRAAAVGNIAFLINRFIHCTFL
jgi:hypothetical protein